MKFLPVIALTLGCTMAMTGCVKKSVFEEQSKRLNETQQSLKDANDRLDKTSRELDKTSKNLDQTSKDLAASRAANKQLTAAKGDLESALKSEQSLTQDYASKLASMQTKNDQQASENSRLEQELENLRRMRAAADKQNAQFRTLIEKLRAMIDAGTLKVTIRNGQMIVQLSNDILFAPGGVNLKKDGKEAIIQLAETIREFTDRRFLVVGHSDNAPINTPRYPSNWELSSQRAIEVVKILIANGVSEKNLIASGNAEFDPLAENDTPENKKINRRVEVVFMPSIEALPTFDEQPAQDTATANDPTATGNK